MEEDILNFSPTVMFRGTPCTLKLHTVITRKLWIGKRLLDLIYDFK